MAGCGSSQTSAAAGAAESFAKAVAAHDGAAGCALLAPVTRRELEQDGPCVRALAELQLPSGATVSAADVFGDQARVVLNADTLFLARINGTWRIVAAGCAEQGEGLPYSCQLSGS